MSMKHETNIYIYIYIHVERVDTRGFHTIRDISTHTHASLGTYEASEFSR